MSLYGAIAETFRTGKEKIVQSLAIAAASATITTPFKAIDGVIVTNNIGVSPGITGSVIFTWTFAAATGIVTIFEQLEDFPTDWRDNPAAFAAYCRDHQAQSFMEYAEYPDVTALEVVKSLRVKGSLSDMLDQMQ